MSDMDGGKKRPALYKRPEGEKQWVWSAHSIRNKWKKCRNYVIMDRTVIHTFGAIFIILLLARKCSAIFHFTHDFYAIAVQNAVDGYPTNKMELEFEKLSLNCVDNQLVDVTDHWAAFDRFRRRVMRTRKSRRWKKADNTKVWKMSKNLLWTDNGCTIVIWVHHCTSAQVNRKKKFCRIEATSTFTEKRVKREKMKTDPNNSAQYTDEYHWWSPRISRST